MLMTNGRHTSLTSLAIYAKPTFNAVAKATAAIDPQSADADQPPPRIAASHGMFRSLYEESGKNRGRPGTVGGSFDPCRRAGSRAAEACGPGQGKDGRHA